MACEVTLERLSALLAGDLDAAQAHLLRQHIGQCPTCTTSIARLQEADRQLRSVAERVPSAVVQRARQVIRSAVQHQPTPEVMTLEEVAQYLRLGASQLAQVLEQLPSFTVAGEVRVRRDRLMQWINDQEQQAFRDRVRSQAARSIRLAFEQGIAS